MERRLDSWASASVGSRFIWPERAGGCTDFALAARVLPIYRRPSALPAKELSIEVREKSATSLSAARLGRLFALDAKVSVRSGVMPAPIDLRGGFGFIVFDTGG